MRGEELLGRRRRPAQRALGLVVEERFLVRSRRIHVATFMAGERG
jgi:hypothetical protein